MGEGAGGMIWENSIETCILSSVKQIASPGWMHETSAGAGALGWPRGMGWGGRWEGGSGWGMHLHPWQIHVSVWQKPLQYCKVISLQLIKIIGRKTNKKNTWYWIALFFFTFFTKYMYIHTHDFSSVLLCLSLSSLPCHFLMDIQEVYEPRKWRNQPKSELQYILIILLYNFS